MDLWSECGGDGHSASHPNFSVVGPEVSHGVHSVVVAQMDVIHEDGVKRIMIGVVVVASFGDIERQNLIQMLSHGENLVVVDLPVRDAGSIVMEIEHVLLIASFLISQISLGSFVVVSLVEIVGERPHQDKRCGYCGHLLRKKVSF